MKILGVFLIFLLTDQIYVMCDKNCGDGQAVTQREEEYKKYCGPELDTLVQKVCRGKYASLPFKRKVHAKLMSPVIEKDVRYPYIPPGSLANIFEIEKENIVEILRRARMAGIVDQCCFNSCSETQIKEYCD